MQLSYFFTATKTCPSYDCGEGFYYEALARIVTQLGNGWTE